MGHTKPKNSDMMSIPPGCVGIHMLDVLIVDDDDLMRATVGDLLSDRCRKVVLAENGDAALHTLQDFAPDVVVTDIYMPDRDGVETICALRKRHPDVGIVAMTGGSESYADIGTEPVSDKMLISLGASSVLRKPFREEELCDAIRQAVLDVKFIDRRQSRF